jgi:type IV secretory pathway VirB10-like protein
MNRDRKFRCDPASAYSSASSECNSQRGLDIQPTLEIRPGYRFNIMVTKDVVIRPWKQ